MDQRVEIGGQLCRDSLIDESGHIDRRDVTRYKVTQDSDTIIKITG
jgi:hypothetical protein